MRRWVLISTNSFGPVEIFIMEDAVPFYSSLRASYDLRKARIVLYRIVYISYRRYTDYRKGFMYSDYLTKFIYASLFSSGTEERAKYMLCTSRDIYFDTLWVGNITYIGVRKIFVGVVLILNVGCWILDVGCWMLDVGCWMLDAGCRVLDIGYNGGNHSTHVAKVRLKIFSFSEICNEFVLPV